MFRHEHIIYKFRYFCALIFLALLPTAGYALEFELSVTSADVQGKCLHQGQWVDVKGTVYEVARLTEEKISALIENGVIKTTLVAQELNDALGKARKPSTTKLGAASEFAPQEGLGFRVRLSNTPDESTASRIRELVRELRSLKLEVEVGSTLESFFQPVGASLTDW